jgi:hypothetical protein
MHQGKPQGRRIRKLKPWRSFSSLRSIFGPENRNGIRAGQYINDIGTPLFQRFVQLFFDVAKDEGLPAANLEGSTLYRTGSYGTFAG